MILYCSLFAAFTAINAHAGDGSKTAIDQEVMSDMKIEMLSDKFKKNGHKILCRQEDYLSCYNMSEQQCTADITSFNDSCIQYTNDKIEEISNKEERPKKMGKIYATCLMMKHISMHSASLDQVKNCLKTVKIDKGKIKKSLME